MEQGTYTLQEIEFVTDIDIAMLYLIKRRISWINVSKFYDVETRIENPDISTKDISLEISKSYNINYDKIRHFINRYKNKNVQRLSKDY